jgi:hypothetical protein
MAEPTVIVDDSAFLKSLDTVFDQLVKDAWEAEQARAQRVLEAAKRRIHSVSGDLADSGQVIEGTDENGRFVGVEFGTDHAIPHEFGTSTQEPHPYIRPSVEEERR